MIPESKVEKNKLFPFESKWEGVGQGTCPKEVLFESSLEEEVDFTQRIRKGHSRLKGQLEEWQTMSREVQDVLEKGDFFH